MKCKRLFICIFATTVLTTLTYALTIKTMKEDRKEIVPKYHYSEKEMDKVYDYIERQYGVTNLVGHEKYSTDIHCDIVIVKPTEEQPYYKLITMGAGAYKMNVPLKWKTTVCHRAEYVVFLPESWNLISGKEEDYWPIRMLKTIARLPIETDSWLSYNHTVQLTDDNGTLASNVGYNSCVLLPSTGIDGKEVKPVKLSIFGKEVAFYQLLPLYPEELEYKLEHSIDELMNRLNAKDNLIIDIHRKNSCK